MRVNMQIFFYYISYSLPIFVKYFTIFAESFDKCFNIKTSEIVCKHLAMICCFDRVALKSTHSLFIYGHCNVI